ncbi:MAG: right-handed parallel beta-helix repeat-containing protein [Bacteroidia bacterium]|nr:right-handed parallel beta-helix repeat-containing protein [Bacteroidia bacterium]
MNKERYLYIVVLLAHFLLLPSKSLLMAQSSKSAVDITRYLPQNYRQDGTVDYTSYIQKGLDENRYVKMPNFPILINENGLKIKSNSEIYFQRKSKLIMAPNHRDAYAMLWLVNVRNVKIHSPHLIGDRFSHKGAKGEWGMGIHITQSDDIYISNAIISNCWGDGIYIGGGTTPCVRVKIEKAKIGNSRRNGISITNGKSITISNSVITNTNGTPPMAAIDIEPNKPSNVIDDINIKDVETKNNKKYGVLIELNPLIQASNKVKITIDGHKDSGSATALAIAEFRGNLKNRYQLNGEILILNSVWEDNIEEPYQIGEFRLGPRTRIENYKIIKNNRLQRHTPKIIIRNENR